VKEIGTPLGTCIGAPDYTAPEQNRGEPLTQSDLYAIGATLIFLLTGESPQKFFELIGSGYGFNLKSDPRIPPQVRETIEKATESKPSDRYQTAAELARALSRCL
jgi:serine/threonine-protein kinase